LPSGPTPACTSSGAMSSVRATARAVISLSPVSMTRRYPRERRVWSTLLVVGRGGSERPNIAARVNGAADEHQRGRPTWRQSPRS
jgi:hypothetical protein